MKTEGGAAGKTLPLLLGLDLARAVVVVATSLPPPAFFFVVEVTPPWWLTPRVLATEIESLRRIAR